MYFEYDDVLPVECWELIRDSMSPDDPNRVLNNVSLVSKQFLSVTRFLRRRMHIHDYRYSVCPCYNRVERQSETDNNYLRKIVEENFQSLPEYRKYRNLSQVSIRCCCLMNGLDMDILVADILCVSGLDLHEIDMYQVRSSKPPSFQTWRLLGSKMNNLKVVKYRDSSNFNNENLIAIGDALPLLEELDVSSHSSQISDYGVEKISTKLPLLQKFTNIILMDGNGRTFTSPSSLSGLVGCCKASLKRLELIGLSFLTNDMISQLCTDKNLPNLSSVRIRNCNKVTEIAFFILSRECPPLQQLRLHLGIESHEDVLPYTSSHKNFNIRTVTLTLRPTKYEMLKKIADICPNLELLNLRYSPKAYIVSNGGLECIMESCPLLNCLIIWSHDEGVKGLLSQIDTSRLKIIMPAGHGISRCHGLF